MCQARCPPPLARAVSRAVAHRHHAVSAPALQLHSALYVALQCTGAIAGAALSSALLPPRDLFSGDIADGCFDTRTMNPALTHGQMFGWVHLWLSVWLMMGQLGSGAWRPGHHCSWELAAGAGAGGGGGSATMGHAADINS
jgi:hypothetical protein